MIRIISKVKTLELMEDTTATAFTFHLLPMSKTIYNLQIAELSSTQSV